MYVDVTRWCHPVPAVPLLPLPPSRFGAKERLSFGITLLLVVEVMRTSVATFVPICGELLWIDLFMLVNSVPGVKIC